MFPIQDAEKDFFITKFDSYRSGRKKPAVRYFSEVNCSELRNILISNSVKIVNIYERDEDHPEGKKVKLEIDKVCGDLKLISKDVNYKFGEPIVVTNFMWFEVEYWPHLHPLYESLGIELTPVGRSQLKFFNDYILNIFQICNQIGMIYSKFFVLIQSSGFGKTKICMEILCTNPGVYMVFRFPGQCAIPDQSEWMSRFSDYIFAANLEDLPVNFNTAIASHYTQGKFLLGILTVISAYKIQILNLIKKSEMVTIEEKIKEAIHLMGRQNFLDCSDVDIALEIIFPENSSMTIKNVRDRICSEVQDVVNLTRNSGPFMLFIDAANILKSKYDKKRLEGLDLIRLSLHLLDNHTRMIVIAISTECDALNYTPQVLENLYSPIQRKYVLSPFIFTRNWDIMIDDLDLGSFQMTREILLNRTYFIILTMMGRPLWSSVPWKEVIILARAKLDNGLIDLSVSGYIAKLLVRSNLNVNTKHALAKNLVRLFMMIVNYISADSSDMKISYSSEPILGIAARVTLKEFTSRESSFRALKLMVEQGAIENNRITEFVFEQLTLFAIDDSEEKLDTNIVFSNDPSVLPQKLKKFSQLKTQVLLSPEVFENDSKNRTYLPQISDYHVISVGLFLKTKFGTDVFEAIKPTLSTSLLNGLINATQLIHLKNSNQSNQTKYRIIDRSLLNCGLMRFCGYVMPTGYYGINYIIPVILDDPEKRFNRPVYSFIAFQTSTIRSVSLDECASKMIASLHVARCGNPNHKDEAFCIKNICNSYLTQAELDFIYENQVTVLLSAKNYRIKNQQKSTISFKSKRLTLLIQEIEIKKEELKEFKNLHNYDTLEISKLEDQIEHLENKLSEEVAVRYKQIEPEVSRLSGTELYARKHPHFKNKIFCSPDYINLQKLNKDCYIYKMIWNESLKRKIVCISCENLNVFNNLVGRNTLAIIKELMDLDTSNYQSVESLNRPIIQDSLLNGVFSPYEDLNPFLRKMRSLENNSDPFENYFSKTLTASDWKNSCLNPIKGQIDCAIRVHLKPEYYETVELRLAQELEKYRELFEENDDEEEEEIYIRISE